MIDVTRIAELVCEGMRVSPRFRFIGKKDSEGGFPIMLHDASKLKYHKWNMS